MRSLLVCAVTVLLATSALAVAPPPNDDCSNATVVGALPYTDEVDTLLARPGFGDDDPLGCGPGNGPTVWYEFVPPADGYYCARTCGSDYDTVLGTRLGTCFGPDHDCNDDECDLESVVWFDGTAGSPVLFVIGAYEFSPKAARGGYLAFSVMDASADSDGDGVFDCDDNCVETTNPMQPDADFDGLGDECETCTGFGGNGQDTDGDGICGYADRCPFVANPAQTDADHDLSGDECDQCAGAGGVDQDLDGICDDVADNCPTVYNPDQLDSDDDFIGDACDGCPDFFGGGTTDTDGDSVPDACDVCPNDPTDACATIWGCIAEEYPSSDESLLVRVNPATGITKTVGSLGTWDCRGLAFEPGTGRLLAFARSLIEDTFDLFSVDPATAAITRIGPVTADTAAGNATGGMAFRSDGRLYASIGYGISTIDPATGAETFLGNGGDYPGGLAFDGTGRLLRASRYYEFAEIDQTTGEVATMLPDLVEPYGCEYGVDDVFGFTALGNTLYTAFFCYPYSLLGTVDPATGIVGTIGQTPDHLSALTAEVCGNGTREGGEECDDGNTLSGDCCSATCRVEAAGSSCPDDGSACTTEACDGAGSCMHEAAPPVGCVDGSPGRATLAIIGGPDPHLAWKWRGTIDVFGSFGNPILTTDVTLCLADGSDTLLSSATAPAGGVCPGGSGACWQPKGSGFVYRDLDRTPQGIEKMSLASSPQPGKAKLKVKARGPNLDLAALPYTTPLRAWLIGNDGGGCWKASYSSTRRNDVKKLKAISD